MTLLQFLDEGASFKDVMDGLERKFLIELLQSEKGIQVAAARRAKITRQGLLKKIRKHELQHLTIRQSGRPDPYFSKP